MIDSLNYTFHGNPYWSVFITQKGFLLIYQCIPKKAWGLLRATIIKNYDELDFVSCRFVCYFPWNQLQLTCQLRQKRSFYQKLFTCSIIEDACQKDIPHWHTFARQPLHFTWKSTSVKTWNETRHSLASLLNAWNCRNSKRWTFTSQEWGT